MVTAGPKTYVLQHGAWHGGWCWADVAERLRDAGHRVITPTATGLGERSHLLSRGITLDTFVTDLVHVLEWDDLRDVVLVGHSFGGIAITGAADRVPQRIRQLVYLDSLILQSGQSAFSQLPPDVVARRRQQAQASSGGLSIPVPDPADFGVHDVRGAAWLRARCTPHPLSVYESPLALTHPVGNGLPARYIAVKPDYAPLAASRAYARTRSDWAYTEVTAGHDMMITSPALLTDLLLAR